MIYTYISAYYKEKIPLKTIKTQNIYVGSEIRLPQEISIYNQYNILL